MKKTLHLALLIFVLEVAVSACAPGAFNSCPGLKDVLDEPSNAIIIGEVRASDFSGPSELNGKDYSFSIRSEVMLKHIIRNSANKFPASFSVVETILLAPADIRGLFPAIGATYALALNKATDEAAKYADFQVVRSSACT